MFLALVPFATLGHPVGRRGRSARPGRCRERVAGFGGQPVGDPGEMSGGRRRRGRACDDGPIVVGVDGSRFGTNALRYALAEAALRKTSVRAVAAYDVLPPHAFAVADPELVARMRAGFEAEAAGSLTQALEDAQGSDPGSVSVDRVVVQGRPADAILGQTADAQLIVVGTHGKGLVRRVLLGSVSRQVLNDADRPVTVVDLPDN